jgi:hypothetical protein
VGRTRSILTTVNPRQPGCVGNRLGEAAIGIEELAQPNAGGAGSMPRFGGEIVYLRAARNVRCLWDLRPCSSLQ